MSLFRIYSFLLPCLFLILLACNENPQKSSVVDLETQDVGSVPQGHYLYCITNIGHTLRVFDLSTEQLLESSQKRLDLDPVGPWFYNNKAYYLSRVDSSGSGKNALVEFDPVTLQERRRFYFPANSNPTTLLMLPDEGVALVALKGSTFDDWSSNGIIRFDLNSWKEANSLNFNAKEAFQEGQRITSLSSLLYNASTKHIYALAENWYYSVRQGWLLVLDPQTLEILDSIKLGLNPQGNMLLEGEELWVVNNGGYADYGGSDGSLQVLDSKAFVDGISNNESSFVINVSGDPTHIYRFSSTQAWLTTYPDDLIRVVNLKTHSLEVESTGLPKLTGPLLTTSEASFFAGMGGFGSASLGKIDTQTGQLLSQFPLDAGNGGVNCSEYQVP